MGVFDPDTQERHETLLHIEKQLENGRRGDTETLSTGQVILSKCVRVLQAKVYDLEKTIRELKKQKQHLINWPTAGIICSIIFGIVQIINNNGVTP
jgi:hypothetical protein